jgi:hypothetical protein
MSPGKHETKKKIAVTAVTCLVLIVTHFYVDVSLGKGKRSSSTTVLGWKRSEISVLLNS